MIEKIERIIEQEPKVNLVLKVQQEQLGQLDQQAHMVKKVTLEQQVLKAYKGFKVYKAKEGLREQMEPTEHKVHQG
jgi:hypothetical protein